MTRLRTFRVTPLLATLLVVVLTALGAGAGLVVEHTQSAEYQVNENVLVRFWSIEGYLLTGQANPVDSLDVADVATLASGLGVLDAAAKSLGDGTTGSDLSSSVTVTPQTTSNSVQISATGPTAAKARATANAVGAALMAAVQDQITTAESSLSADRGADSDTAAQLQQRAQALSSTVEPLEALAAGEATQTKPSGKTPLAMGVVGLAAAALVLVGLVFGRPLVGTAREAQRLLEVPAVPFGTGTDQAAARLLRRLLDDRPAGSVLVVPLDDRAETAAQSFLDWARDLAVDPIETARLELAPEPTGAVLRPRPAPEAVAAVLLIAPAGTNRRDLTDGATLLRTWRGADAAVLTVGPPARGARRDAALPVPAAVVTAGQS